MNDFVAGRYSAVEALRLIGQSREPILIGTSRQPIWPAAIVGSITHTKGVAAAIAAFGQTHSGLGIDLEYLKPLHDLAAHICTPDELSFVREHPGIPDYLNVLFSAKEAVYKCLWPLARRFISFHEVELALDYAGRSFRIAWHDSVHPVADRVYGFWATAADMVAAVAILDRH